MPNIVWMSSGSMVSLSWNELRSYGNLLKLEWAQVLW